MRKIFALLSMIVALSPSSAVLAQEGAQQFEKFQLQGYTEGQPGTGRHREEGEHIDLTNAQSLWRTDVNPRPKRWTRSGPLKKDVVITRPAASYDGLFTHKNDDLVTTEAVDHHRRGHDRGRERAEVTP